MSKTEIFLQIFNTFMSTAGAFWLGGKIAQFIINRRRRPDTESPSEFMLRTERELRQHYDAMGYRVVELRWLSHNNVALTVERVRDGEMLSAVANNVHMFRKDVN